MPMDPKSLTVDYRTLLKNTSLSDRVNMTRSSQGTALLSALTPTELGSLFPDYYKRNYSSVASVISSKSRGSSAGAAAGETTSTGYQAAPVGTGPRGVKVKGERTATPISMPSQEYKDPTVARLEKMGFNIPSNMGSVAAPGAGLASWQGAPVSSKRIEQINKTKYARMIEEEAKKIGMNPDVVKAMVSIESSGSHGEQTGSYSGLLQSLGGAQQDPRTHVSQALLNMKKMSDNFEKSFGRPPTPTETYLMHQQGAGGGPAHVAAFQKNVPAWKTMLETGEGQRRGESWAKQAIWGNIPTDIRREMGFSNVKAKNWSQLSTADKAILDQYTSAHHGASYANKLQGISFQTALKQIQESGVAGAYGSKQEEQTTPEQKKEFPKGTPQEIVDYVNKQYKDNPAGQQKFITSYIDHVEKKYGGDVSKFTEEWSQNKTTSSDIPIPTNSPLLKKQLSGVDPRLANVSMAAIEKFKELNPGYDVKIISGKRHPLLGGGGSRHDVGNAVDFQIVGPDGKPLANLGGPANAQLQSGANAGFTAPKYIELHRLAEAARRHYAQTDTSYNEGGQLSSGAFFGPGKAWMDSMHLSGFGKSREHGAASSGDILPGFKSVEQLKREGYPREIIQAVENSIRAGGVTPLASEDMDNLRLLYDAENSKNVDIKTLAKLNPAAAERIANLREQQKQNVSQNAKTDINPTQQPGAPGTPSPGATATPSTPDRYKVTIPNDWNRGIDSETGALTPLAKGFLPSNIPESLRKKLLEGAPVQKTITDHYNKLSPEEKEKFKAYITDAGGKITKETAAPTQTQAPAAPAQQQSEPPQQAPATSTQQQTSDEAEHVHDEADHEHSLGGSIPSKNLKESRSLKNHTYSPGESLIPTGTITRVQPEHLKKPEEKKKIEEDRETRSTENNVIRNQQNNPNQASRVGMASNEEIVKDSFQEPPTGYASHDTMTRYHGRHQDPHFATKTPANYSRNYTYA